MSKKTADQIIEKYQRGVAGAAGDYAQGVQSPSRPWAQAAQQGAKRWASGVQKAIQENAFQKGVSKAGDAKWQEAALNKGAQRYAAAAGEAASEYAKVAGAVMSAAAAAQSAVANMPDETLDQRIARSAAAQRAVSGALKRS